MSRKHVGLFCCLLAVIFAVAAAAMIYLPAGIATAAVGFGFTGYTLLYMEAKNASA